MLMKTLFCVVDGLIIALTALLFGLVLLVPGAWFVVPIAVILFLIVNVIPSPVNRKYKKLRLRICADGADLLCSFLIGAVVAALAHIICAFYVLPDSFIQFIVSCVISFIVLSIAFWNGIIRVYLTSVQLGIKHRVIGILLGMIPVAHLFALAKIISVCNDEVKFENDKELLNDSRKDEQSCKTKFPVLLVHGVFFRDFKYVNYWGRIPNELIRNGATVFYGNHQSALSVADSGRELAERIKQITKETGCEKVNVIAHSKGGLDCRYAISLCGAESMVASLTTINTPHHGCLFADYLLTHVPDGAKNTIAKSYNAASKHIGDTNPDFLAAVYDLTNENCEALNGRLNDSPDIYYQSVGSKLNKATNGKFPLNFTYHIVKHFDGVNDGLVSKESACFGSSFTFLETDGKRGISHGDMVDLNRENIKGFDVREFYVQLVRGLKEKGF